MSLFVCFILLTFGKLTVCRSEIKHVIEGDNVLLNFSYPCARVTLQHGIEVPFYTLADSESISPHSYEGNRFSVKSNNGRNNCSLFLSISPVMREDKGTYILILYDDNDDIGEIKKIGLRVDFPPGEASCTPSEEHMVDNLVTLLCSAPVGSLLGRIECYQNGNKLLSPLTAPIESDGLLEQTITAQNNTYPLFCCSSALVQTKDRCDCNDFQWDFVHNTIPSTSTTNPCAPTTIIPGKLETNEVTFSDSKTKQVITETTTNKMEDDNSVSHHYMVSKVSVIVIFGVVLIVLLAYIFQKRHKINRNGIPYRGPNHVTALNHV